MRKQARRLWFGDWRRDEEPADDTVVISQVEDETAEPEPVVERKRNVRRGAILAAGAIFIAAVIALSSGGDKKPLTSERATTPPAQQTPQAQPQVPQGQIPPQATPPQGQGVGGGAHPPRPPAAKAAQAGASQDP